MSNVSEPSPVKSSPSTGGPSIDEVDRIAQTLDPDDRLRLIARLWGSLPPGHWAAPNSNEWVDVWRRLSVKDAKEIDNVPWEILRRVIENRERAPTKLYSVPRRFDMATIFVVTFAFSLLFAAMSGLRFPPAASLVIGGFIALVGVGQALLFGGKRPRTASLVVGASIYFLGMLTFWLSEGQRMYPTPAILVMGSYSVIGGAILGYLSGVLIGGVFLVADVVRRKFQRGIPSNENDSAGGDQMA
jgi:hypothetical protein